MSYGRPPDDVQRTRDGQQERHCIGCGKWLPLSSFPRRGIFYRSKCRECERAYRAARTGRAETGNA